MQRRQFLAAAAALTALPQAAQAEAAGNTTTPGEIVEDRSVTDDGTYSLTDCGSVPGGLNNVHVTAEMNDGPLEIEGVHEENGWCGVGLRWSSGPIEVGTGLDPDDAREEFAGVPVNQSVPEGTDGDAAALAASAEARADRPRPTTTTTGCPCSPARRPTTLVSSRRRPSRSRCRTSSASRTHRPRTSGGWRPTWQPRSTSRCITRTPR